MLAVLLVIVIGGVVYIAVGNKDSSSSSSGKNHLTAAQTYKNKHAPTLKPDTKGPTITSTKPIAPSGPATGPAPKAAAQ